MAHYTLFTRYYVASSCPISEVLKSSSRDSSVGRASDWRSEGPWFNPGSRHFPKSNASRKQRLRRVEKAERCILQHCNVFQQIWRNLQNWRIRVSIPVPLECKSSALPLELIPRTKIVFREPCNGMNISILWFPIVIFQFSMLHFRYRANKNLFFIVSRNHR